MVKNILILILVVALILFIYQLFFNNPSLSSVKVNLKGKSYDLEVARTVPQLTKGLMDRPSLCPNCGMIFVYNLELPQVFWMKNTLIPLDLIFIDHTSQIINIVTANPQPGVPDSQLKFYKSTSPAKYVIELNASDANKLFLKPGDIIDLSGI
jgi:uncharacterized membrane protein (UPF0127 family)